MRRVDVLDITYQQLFEHATVCEAMRVAILHMQVNVCMFEGRQVSRTGITRFRKNIICFPQHVSDLQQHIDFTNSVAVNDILNIRRYPIFLLLMFVHRKSFELESPLSAPLDSK